MKVLIAVDGSDIADKALDWYFANIHKSENEVFICYKAEQPDLPTVMFSAGASFPAAEIAAIMTEHNKKLGDLENKYTMSCKQHKANYKVNIETCGGGKPGHNIVKEAEKQQSDMIVMGTRGHGLIKRTVLGSVSSYIVHHAKIPVCICPM